MNVPYDEQSFLNGLAAGLTATGAVSNVPRPPHGYAILPYFAGPYTKDNLTANGVCLKRLYSWGYHGEFYGVRTHHPVVKYVMYGDSEHKFEVYACLSPSDGNIAETHYTRESGQYTETINSIYRGNNLIYYDNTEINSNSVALGNWYYNTLEEALAAIDDGVW